jgi:hypothetical protein
VSIEKYVGQVKDDKEFYLTTFKEKEDDGDKDEGGLSE